MVAGTQTTTIRKSVARRLLGRDGVAAYIFLAPWLIGLVGITLGPLIASLGLSFTHYDLFSNPSWIGLANYQQMLADAAFLQSAQVTLNYVVVTVPSILVIALALAIMLDRGVAGLTIYRALFYVPSLLGGSVAIAVLWRQVFGETGMLEPDPLAVPDSRSVVDRPARYGALYAGCPQRLAVRRDDDHFSRRPASDSEGTLRGCRGRRRDERPPLFLRHDPDAHAGHLFQRRARADSWLSGLHLRVHRQRRKWWASRLRLSFTRSTCINRGSPTTTWATRQGWPGSFSSSSPP